VNPRPEIDLSGLPTVTPLRVVMRTRVRQSIPAFPGSALHGALGHALWKTVCAFPQRRGCAGCPLLGRCAYPALFASHASNEALRHLGIREQTPHPMVLAPEDLESMPSGHPRSVGAHTELSFRLTLIGRALEELPLLVVALRQMADRGIGKPYDGAGTDEPRSYAGAELIRITSHDGGHIVYDAGAQLFSMPAAIAPHTIQCHRGDVEQVAIRLLTPLRLKRNGKFQGRPSPADFLLTLARRANALASLYGCGRCLIDQREMQTAAAELKEEPPETRLVLVRRYSARQQRPMEWPGVIGVLRWRGAPLDWLIPLLKFGEIVQIGKGAALGFGRYTIQATL
jgi:hypothetical protein